MQKFEYETIEIEATMWTSRPKDLEETLNHAAKDGWKLVQVLPPAYGGFGNYLIILERPVR